MTATGRVIATSSMAIASELLHGAESPDSADMISASTLGALSAASTQQFTDSRV